MAASTTITHYPCVSFGALHTGIQDDVAYAARQSDGAYYLTATSANVLETGVLGDYEVRNGISLPADFDGRILWSRDSGVTWHAQEVVNYSPVYDQLNTFAEDGDGVSGPGAV